MADGFIDDGAFARFRGSRFLDARLPTFGHLHGSLRYRVPNEEAHRDILPSYEVVQFARDAIVPAGFVDLRRARTAADDFTMVGAIVTGLHKLDKIATEPYGTYGYALERDLYDAQHALLIGYGGGDGHVNMRLWRAAQYHGKSWRTAIVTYGLPQEDDALRALVGLLGGLDNGIEFEHSFEEAKNAGGVGSVGRIHLDARGFLTPGQGASVIRALAGPR
jgi:hypothetical protein